MKTNQCKCGNVKRENSEMCRQCFLNYYLTRTHKFCKGCQTDSLLSEFRKRDDGRPRSRCKKCEANSARMWRKSNPEEHKQRKRAWATKYPEKVKRASLRRGWKKMGLNPDSVELYLKTHNGQCEICGTKEDYQALSIDHCHTTNKFRGVLCSRCNSGLGFFKDKIDSLEKAINYLKKSQSDSFDTLRPYASV